MKILFLTNIPSPYRMDFFNMLGKYCDLTVTFEGKRAIDRDAKWIGSQSEHFREVYLNGIRVSNSSFFCPDIINVLKQGFDHIIVSNYADLTSIYAMMYMKSHHIRYWIEADGGLIPKSENAIKFYIKKLLIGSASYWLSSGKITTEYFEHYGANSKKIYEYPFTSIKEDDILPFTTTKEEKQEIRKKLGIRGNTVVLSVGQFIYRKGYDVLLKAWKRCPTDSSLYIVGGKPTEEYKTLKENLSLSNVFFVEFKSKKELKEFYKAADIFVLPTREDIWGLVVNEAMANGLPVITTNRCVAGLELIKNGMNGFIVPVDDEKCLAEYITQLSEDQNLRNILGKNNLTKISEYTIENMVKQHLDILGDNHE